MRSTRSDNKIAAESPFWKNPITIDRFPVGSLLVWIMFLALPLSALVMADSVQSIQEPFRHSIELERYVLQTGPIKIETAVKNLSGLTYNLLTDSLFLVSNRPTTIIEIDQHGGEKRTIDLQGFQDTEGITHIRENLFAVLEEKRRSICIFEIDQQTTTINRAQTEIILIDPRPAGNKGPEGISYDPDGGRFYVTKEKNPRMLYRFPWPTSSQNSAEVSHPWDIQKNALSLTDLSGIFYHQGTGNLLMLSDESASVVETTITGKEISRLSLKKDGKSGLQKDVPQAEGITMDNKGRLYICSEPDLFYVFSRTKK